MHGPADAWSLWQAWRRVEEERADVCRHLPTDPGHYDPPAVLWGRQRYTRAEDILSAPPPAWARLDASAMQRHRERARSLTEKLEAIQRPATGQRGGSGALALENRAQRLAEDARLLASAIRSAPITTPADVLVRLDLIAAMWGPTGEIEEPSAPLAEVLALIEALSRHAPQFVPTWTRRRTAQPS